MDRRQFMRTAAYGGLALLDLPRGFQDPDWKSWRVDGARVNQHLADLSRFGRNPQGGVSRVAFSQADTEGRTFAMDLMRQAGLDAGVDPAGNIVGARPGSQPGALPILVGSHIDSVPEGGNYDGDVGSLAAIEVAQTLGERRYRNRHPLHAVIWCDEESGLTGSRGFIGDLPEEELRRPGRDGVPLADKIKRIGGDPDRIAAARHGPGSVAAYVELHIEQGAILEEKGLQIGIVEGIVGIHHYDVTIRGFANHAGTTPMDRRRNALLAAAELVLVVDRVVRSVPGRQVGTVGRLIVKPGAPNVIPGEVDLTVELRDLSAERIESLWSRIHTEAQEIARTRDVTLDYVLQHTNAPALSDPKLRAVIADAAGGLGLSSQLMPSGAGHDAQDLARICPMGMIFVPSVKGISHSPLEFTRPEDVTNGANVLLQTIVRLDRQ
ncbi:MAG TPA: Zn-dependent hydrolase [Gemmatimonadales bacterium]|nr:Zn-dependent hydrolase [Gemmatimonadales bacterium]